MQLAILLYVYVEKVHACVFVCAVVCHQVNPQEEDRDEAGFGPYPPGD